jgi:hypothetical protein
MLKKEADDTNRDLVYSKTLYKYHYINKKLNQNSPQIKYYKKQVKELLLINAQHFKSLFTLISADNTKKHK